MNAKNNARILKMSFSSIYVLYIEKVEKKNRSKAELDEVLMWLTGYDETSLNKQIQEEINLEDFFEQAPAINPNAYLIKGVICGIRVEEIEDPLIQKVRYMDKLVDELAKGKKMEKILRV